MPERKAKLRTASDVISRLRWSNEEHTGNNQNDGLVMMGYTDRIVGPLEKAVKDYISAKSHGDIPEHRILYFRAANDSSLKEQILWDRAGRVNRIFQSGNGPNAPIAAETLQAIQEAKQNMIQIELEKEERRKEKAKLRARRARKRELDKVKLNSKNEETESTQNQPQRRFHWQEAPWYTYSKDEWTTGTVPDNSEVRIEDNQDEDLVIVTWNVLFDIFDAGLEVDEPQLNSTNSANLSQGRWELLASMLKRSEPDLISLQEATPAFVKLLLDCEWVKAEYACSASPSCLQSVTPSGVLILWRRTTMASPSNDYALFQCSDFGRSRSLVATLFSRKNPNASVFAFSSAHLPADKATSGDTAQKSLRKLARKRELSSILGQLQRLGAQLLGKQIVSMTPIIAGDFNCEDDELKDGLFAGSSDKLYRDIWSEYEGGPGLTFDPTNNPRAARSSGLVGGEGRARRIDRIFVGPTYVSQSHWKASNHIVSKSATLLGNEAGIMPPSDHFGVRASFQYKSHVLKPARLTDAYSHWSTNSPPSPHYMLAVILDSPKLELLKARNDQQSSLPVLHVTLLHGFVEADFGCLDLVKSVVQDALHFANTSVPPPESLEFTSDDSLGVFERRASATLVAHPDIDSAGQQWLCKLYDTLRERFQLCDEQETHSSTGWNPHVTMGVAGSSSAARTMQARWIADGTWTAHHEHAAIHSVDVLRRGASGMFQTLASFPILTQSLPRKMEDFITDAGVSMSQHMDQQAARVLSRLKRACRKVVQDRPVETSIRLVGSALLKTALPGFSDLDAVIMLRPQSGDVNALAHLRELTRENSFLQHVAAVMKEDYPTIKARLRPGGRAVVLTIRIPNLASLDLTLCCSDTDDKPIDECSQTSLATIRDGNTILEAFAQYDLTAAFQGAVRIIKLWAHQHNVYGSITGYLGGGGWAMWVAACVFEGLKSGDLLLDWQADTAQKSHQLVCFFFDLAAKTDLSAPIMPNLLNESAVSPSGPHRTGTLSVLSPCSNGDFGKSSTLSTSHVTLTEIRAAASTLQAGRSELGAILTTGTLADSLMQFPSIVVFELIRDNRTTRLNLPAELKAWGCQKTLEILIELEQHFDPAKIRPMPKPLRLGKDWMPLDEMSTLPVQGFAWLLGLYSDFIGLTDKIESIASKVTLDATASGLHCKFHVLSSRDAVRRFAQSRQAIACID